jgi:hypothetical protein
MCYREKGKLIKRSWKSITDSYENRYEDIKQRKEFSSSLYYFLKPIHELKHFTTDFINYFLYPLGNIIPDTGIMTAIGNAKNITDIERKSLLRKVRHFKSLVFLVGNVDEIIKKIEDMEKWRSKCIFLDFDEETEEFSKPYEKVEITPNSLIGIGRHLLNIKDLLML